MPLLSLSMVGTDLMLCKDDFKEVAKRPPDAAIGELAPEVLPDLCSRRAAQRA